MPSGRKLSFRPATDQDLAFAARAQSECVPHHPSNEAELNLDWRLTRGMGPAGYWVVEGLGWLGVVVPEGGRGFGYVEVWLPGAEPPVQAEAVTFAEARGGELGMTEAVAEVWEDQAWLLSALAGLGYARRRRERYWRLELPPHADRLRTEYSALLERVRAGGAEILPASELGGEAVYPALMDIHNKTHEDIPRSVHFVPETWEVWYGWMEETARPERVWLAVVDGLPVGYSYLAHHHVGRVETGYTGLLREHRGRGIARAMKLATLVQAAAEGVPVVQTDNDSENGPIIHLNQALGYEEITGQVELAKQLG